MTEREIKLLIKDKAEEISRIIKSGKNVEIHLAKDGIKVYAVAKKILK